MKKILLFCLSVLIAFNAYAVDVQISQLTDNPDPATRGGNITYSVSLLNGDGDTANDVTLSIPIPANTNFYVSRRASSLDDNTFNLFGTDGAKLLTLESLNHRVDVMFKSGTPADPTIKVPAMMTLQSQQMSTLQVHSGQDFTAKLKLEDHSSGDNRGRRGFVFERGDGANNKLGLNRMTEGGGTITCVASSSTCTNPQGSNFFPQYAVGDFISVAVDQRTPAEIAAAPSATQYVDVVRTIMSIAGAQLTVNSMFSGTYPIVAQPYQVGKRVMTVESDDIVVFGGCQGCQNAGNKVLQLSSSDASAELIVEGLGDRSLLTLRGGEDAVLDVGCGTDDDASILLRDRETKRGFEFTRKTGSGGASEINMLQLDRTMNGPGATVTVAAGSTATAAAGGVYVHASADGVFSGIAVGDQIVITVGAREEARTVSQISDPNNAAAFLGANPDYVKVVSAFSASAVLSNVPFHVKRKVMTIQDDHVMQFGGSTGDKLLKVDSTLGSAAVTVSAAGASRDASLSLNSAGGDSTVVLSAAATKSARLTLADGALGTGTGFVLERDTISPQGSDVGNTLSLYWTGPGPGTTLSATGGSTTVTLSGAHGNSFKVGEYVAVTHGGQRISRKITAKASTSLTIDAAFTSAGTDLSSVAFERGKRVIAVEDSGGTFRVGGSFGPSGGPIAEDQASLAVSGHLTLAGMWTMRTQSVAAQTSISLESSHLVITAVGTGNQNNLITTSNAALISGGTVLFVENLDDDDTTSASGGLNVICSGQARCMFVYDGNAFQKFSQVDIWN